MLWGFLNQQDREILAESEQLNFLFTHRLVFFNSNFYFILFQNLKNHIFKLKLFLLKIEIFSF